MGSTSAGRRHVRDVRPGVPRDPGPDRAQGVARRVGERVLVSTPSVPRAPARAGGVPELEHAGDLGGGEPVVPEVAWPDEPDAGFPADGVEAPVAAGVQEGAQLAHGKRIVRDGHTYTVTPLEQLFQEADRVGRRDLEALPCDACGQEAAACACGPFERFVGVYGRAMETSSQRLDAVTVRFLMGEHVGDELRVALAEWLQSRRMRGFCGR